MSAICPECDSPIDVDEFDVDIGDELTCAECGSFLRVASDSPLEFELADEDELDEARLLWENQIADLKHVIGSV